MNLTRILFVSLCISFLLLSCSSDKKVTSAASAICECTEPSNELQEKMKSLRGDMDALNALQAEAEQVMADAVVCQKDFEAKYGKDMEDSKFEAKVLESISKLCPSAGEVVN